MGLMNGLLFMRIAFAHDGMRTGGTLQRPA